MFGECHAHIALNGIDYGAAKRTHGNGSDETVIRQILGRYRKLGIDFIRDGGDAFGVSKRAKEIAPEYGIDVRTPVFAIHKNGHYGGIVGRGFDTMGDYAALVDEAAEQGADFIKIMTTGVMDFGHYGTITGESLKAEEVREMVRIAHGQGFAVMSHTNGKAAVLDALAAGVDSIEHGNYIDGECIKAFAESKTAYVPTATVAKNLIGSGRFDDGILKRIVDASRTSIMKAFDAGVIFALGSDAGAVGVAHGQGVFDEYRCFKEGVADRRGLDRRLAEGERFIRSTFTRN